MAHVTFVHGISNKPPAEALLRAWLAALAEDRVEDESPNPGVDLAYGQVSCEMVYWADLLYPAPLPAGVAENLEAVDLEGADDLDMEWVSRADGDEAVVTARLAARLGLDVLAAAGPTQLPAPDAAVEEGLELLPPLLARRVMKTFLRDVHHYLFNTTYSPRHGEEYAIQDTIRARTLEALRRGAERPPPHVLVTHSMGTVIAYDCLKRVDGCPPLAGLMTIGSPLGLDEVQHCLKPQWSTHDGFPSRAVPTWINVFDPLDVVAAGDPRLANDYKRAGARAVEDVREPNWGRWRHDIGKYLRGRRLRGHLADMLEVERV
jgi:hypothetical protein